MIAIDDENYDSFLSNTSIGKNFETFIGIMMSKQRQYYQQRRYPTEITMEAHIKWLKSYRTVMFFVIHLVKITFHAVILSIWLIIIKFEILNK